MFNKATMKDDIDIAMVATLSKKFAVFLEAQLTDKKPASLYEPLNYFLLMGGKRLRPTLLLLACKLYGGDIDAAMNPAMAVELFHNFTLIHDDIMDKAGVRRGQPTVHRKYGENAAILSGDVMMTYANKYLSQYKGRQLPVLLEIFNNTAIQVCEGQQYDMDFEQKEHVSINKYLMMIELKTSVLLAASLQMGALIGGASPAESQVIYEFGKNMGITFQLQDDILDAFGDGQKTGKKVGGDILMNKKTYLLLKALELADDTQKEMVNQWLNTYDRPEEKIAAIKNIFTELDVQPMAEAECNRYHQLALERLNALSLSDEKKAVLKAIAGKLLFRQQ